MRGLARFSILARWLLDIRGIQEVAMKQVGRRLLPLFLIFALFLPSGSSAQQITADPSPFLVPTGLEPAVEFWKRVFTEYSSTELVYFDLEDMSKIYEVVHVGEDSRSNDYINGERARIAAAHGVDIERVKAQRGIKERTAAGIKRSGRYLAQIQEIFRERGLPPELTFLPIVESSYDADARSSVGALGIWQFMPRTGREYMRVAAGIDERRDPMDSSRAAAAYLKQAYEYLGTWPLAITSYNYGQGGMARAVEEVGSANLVDLIQKHDHRYWGFAAKHFYAEFLAAVEIGTNYKQYFPGLERDAAVPIKEVEVTGKATLGSVIAISGLSREEFLSWNPALNSSTRFIPAGYRVKVPTDRNAEPLVQVAAQKTKADPQAEPQIVHHRVKRGETIGQIAQRYGASVQRILQVNNLRHARLLRVGTTLRIPKI
jgi:membrane-bound lytic murein transglycosylase D